jgi:hypothetical protein
MLLDVEFREPRFFCATIDTLLSSPLLFLDLPGIGECVERKSQVELTPICRDDPLKDS